MAVKINGVNCIEWGTTNIQLSSSSETSFTFSTDVVSGLRLEFTDYASMRSSLAGSSSTSWDYSGETTDTLTRSNSLAGTTLNIWSIGLWTQPYCVVNFTSPPSITRPSGISASQNDNGTTTIRWNACTGSYGSGSVTYEVRKNSDTGTLLWSGSSAVTSDINIASNFGYGSSVTIYVIAKYSGISSNNYTTTIFYAPYISNPLNPSVSTAIGPSTVFSWSASSLYYTTGTITYTVLKNGSSIDTTTSTSYNIAEDVAKTWGTSAVTLTVQAKGTGLSNTYSGSTLTSAVSSGVSYTYATTTACGAPTSFTVSDDLSYNPVQLEWSGATDGVMNAITGYNIQYCDSSDNSTWGSWSESTFETSSLITVSPPDTIGYYRKFRIQTCGSAGEAYYSDWIESTNTLRKGMAPFEGFTDPELKAQSTKIKAVHMTEMQNRINDLLLFNGKESFSFTPIIAGETKLSGWTSHIVELRNATDVLRKSHEDWLEIPENKPRVDVMTQLRDVMIGYCKVTITVDGENGLPEGCVVTVRNTEDNSVIAEFKYVEPKMIRIAPGMTYRVECSQSDDYTVSPVSSIMTATENVMVNVELMYRNAMRYGFKREKANPDPSARITYLYDAEGMTPMYVDMTTGNPNYGSWQTFIDEVCRPVMLKYDGTVDYELDHNDQTKKLDGTVSDITNAAYEGNAMVEFRKYKWVHRSEDDQYEYVIFSDAQYDDTYSAYAHINANGEAQDMFYWGMFKGTYSNNRLRSLASGALMVNQTRESEISRAQANGSGTDMATNGYYISYKSGWDYIADILTLLGKSDNSQDVFGRGYVKSTNAATLAPGTLKAKPAFCGYSSGTTDVKVLYIEGAWGNIWDHLAGLRVDPTNGFMVKMTPPYNLNGDGYYITGIYPANSTDAVYVDTASCTDIAGYIPQTVAGTADTFMCDRCSCASSGSVSIIIGGGYTNEGECGSRCMYADTLANQAQAWIGARLSYLSPN